MWEDKTIEETPNNNLTIRAKVLNVSEIAAVVLEDQRFLDCTGSSKVGSHHYGLGRLAEHTLEVVSACFKNAVMFNVIGEIDPCVLFLGALFHDYGKVWDYEYVPEQGTETVPIPEHWVKTEHCRRIHHVSRSAVEWSKAVEMFPKFKDLEEPVLHMILSHHGLKEWGSPVGPKSKEAWLLHLCDSLSARMDDCLTRKK